MIFAVDPFIPDDLLWIFGLAVALGLALVLTMMIEGDELVFITFFMITIGFMVWGGILDGWIFILVLTMFVILVTIEFRNSGGKPI